MVVVCHPEPEDSDQAVVLAGFTERMSELYLKLYYSAVLFVLQSGGPCTCVFVLSLFILFRLAKRQRFKQSLQRSNGAKPGPQEAAEKTSRRRRERDGGSLVIALCSLFFIFEMPAFVSKMYRVLDGSDRRVSSNLSIAGNFATLLDSASNFIVYLASNRLFRQSALSFVTCGVYRGGSRQPGVMSMQSGTLLRTAPHFAAQL